MKKKMKYIILGAVVIVLSFLYAHIDKNTYLYDRDTDSASYISTGILLDGETITQNFVCQEEIIDGINLKSTVTGNMENVTLKYAVTDNDSKQITEGTIHGTEINNNKFNKYEFERISDAIGKSYTLTLTAAGADGSNGVSFYIDPAVPDEQSLKVKGQEVQGALVVRTISHRFDLETFIVLLGFVAFVTAFMKVLYKLFK